MKLFKLLVAVLITGACAVCVHAQKQLKYVPQAVKGAKAVAYAVKPKISPALRPNLAVPVVRPHATVNVTSALERAVEVKLKEQERIARLETNFNELKDAERLQGRIERLKKNLTQLEEYVRENNNKLPKTNDGTSAGKLRWDVLVDIRCLKQNEMKFPVRENTSLFRRYEQLVEENKEQKTKEKTDVTAVTVARLAEDRVPLEGNVVTDDYVEQLLNFYNKLDPFGTGTIR